MTERERLIELIKHKQDGGTKYGDHIMHETKCSNAELADFLLENGVISLPCKLYDTVYLITIKGKQYPIKLIDGYYIIRKLTVSECKRLQTVPEWYEFPVSDTQAYKMLGNGWTVDVIAHLIEATLAENT